MADFTREIIDFGSLCNLFFRLLLEEVWPVSSIHLGHSLSSKTKLSFLLLKPKEKSEIKKLKSRAKNVLEN